ncbi:MAG: hypothetical protein WD696_09370 [Bryobacteraceae bacterium]
MKFAILNPCRLLFGLLLAVTASGQECTTYLPDGLTMWITPDEPIDAGTTFGPMLFTVNNAVQIAPYGPVLIPRHSKIKGQVLTSKEAGRFFGRAVFRVAFEQLITPGRCVFPLNAQLVSAQTGNSWRFSEGKRHKVEDEAIIGRGHAKRDFFFTVFPLTAPYQILRLPARGPRLRLAEPRLLIKVMQPVTLGEPIPLPSPGGGGLQRR